MNNKYKMLLLDDDSKILDSICSYFEMFYPNIKIITGKNGQEGIARLNESNFDIVLTDYEMKPGNGLDVLNYIKDNKIDTLTIIITSHSSKPLLMDSIKLHVHQFIEKPICPTAMKDVFDKVIETLTQKQNRAKLERLGEISATIAHDINNPLSAVSYTHLTLPTIYSV